MSDGYDVLIIKSSIYDEALHQVETCVRNQKNDTLYLVINTTGGDPDRGFRIMQLLDAKYKKIFVLVPDRAMSTGTLMALGADKIYMYHSSSLGPLDLQIEHPADGSWISTLDVRDTMNTIISHIEIASKRIYDQTYNKFGLSKTAAAKIANDNAVKLLQPIVNKIDPYHLHKSFRGAEVGAKYGSILLQNRMYKNRAGVANFISSQLANDYESHSYAITLSEAQKIFLAVTDLSELEEWDKTIRALYESQGGNVKYHSIEAPKKTTEPTKAKKEQKS
jgi:ATP-dependent protease ClpP protease subunit